MLPSKYVLGQVQMLNYYVPYTPDIDIESRLVERMNIAAMVMQQKLAVMKRTL